LTDSGQEAAETQTWLEFSLHCKYIDEETFQRLDDSYEHIFAMLNAMEKKAVFNNRCVCIQTDVPELESYKVLHAKIQQFMKDKGWNTLMITSPRAGEGKTITAINLALTFSKAYDQTVLLVDGDLRRQNIHKTLGFNSRYGLSDYFMDGKPLQDIIIWPGIEKLLLISGGRTIHSSTELLASRRMAELVQEMKTRYDDRYVLFEI
jgi:non-specific protein-tyrosine kinase